MNALIIRNLIRQIILEEMTIGPASTFAGRLEERILEFIVKQGGVQLDKSIVEQTKEASELRATVNPVAAAVFESRNFVRQGDEDKVARIKAVAAVLWSEIDSLAPANQESGRLVSLAKTDLEASIMWAVKAASRFSPSKNL